MEFWRGKKINKNGRIMLQAKAQQERKDKQKILILSLDDFF